VKALQIVAPERVEIVDVPKPDITADQVLVELHAASLCKNADLHYFRGVELAGQGRPPFAPGQPGHEGAGRVVAVGANVRDFTVGDRVAASQHGVYQEYAAVDLTNVVHISDKTAYEEAAPLELGRCIHYATRLAEPLEGKTVAVLGLGPAGLIAVQMTRARGAKEVIGVDVVPSKLSLARELGADSTISATDSDRHGSLLARRDVSVVIECVGSPGTYRDAFEIAEDLVVFFGYNNRAFEVNPDVWYQKGLVIKNVNLGRYREPGRDVDDFRSAARMLELGQLNLKKIITHTLPWTEYEEAIRLLSDVDTLKIVLTFSPEE